MRKKLPPTTKNLEVVRSHFSLNLLNQFQMKEKIGMHLKGLPS